MFIELEVDKKRCPGIIKCGKCTTLCPVDIFYAEKEMVCVNSDNEDECILCNLCIKGCPADALTIKKLYED